MIWLVHLLGVTFVTFVTCSNSVRARLVKLKTNTVATIYLSQKHCSNIIKQLHRLLINISHDICTRSIRITLHRLQEICARIVDLRLELYSREADDY